MNVTVFLVCYIYTSFETAATNIKKQVKKNKDVPVTGRGGPSGCATSRLPHFLDNWLTDDSEMPLTPRRLLVLISVRG
jgi:hypothetical protein